jgi:hypothetical protein
MKLISEKETALLISKSIHWLRRQRWKGGADSIPYRKIGTSVRYNEVDVIKWINDRMLQTETVKINHGNKELDVDANIFHMLKNINEKIDLLIGLYNLPRCAQEGINPLGTQGWNNFNINDI